MAVSHLSKADDTRRDGRYYALLTNLQAAVIIIIIQYLYSALKSCKGYRGAGGFRLRLIRAFALCRDIADVIRM